MKLKELVIGLALGITIGACAVLLLFPSRYSLLHLTGKEFMRLDSRTGKMWYLYVSDPESTQFRLIPEPN